MTKVWMLAMVLICSAAWLVAQDQGSQSGSSQSGSSSTGSASSQTSGSQGSSSQGSMGSSSSASGETSVEGCLQGSSGSYTLTDNSGMTYQLSGDTSKLADHVGHEVKITGTVSSGSSASGSSGSSSSASSSSSSPSSGAGASGGQTLSVDKVQHKSKTCKAGSTSK